MSTAKVAVRETTAQASAHDPDLDGHLDAFRRWRRTEDRQTRQDLICYYLPLVRRIARRYVRTGVPLDDLAQIGSIGLMNAVDSFDPERGVKFEAYAYHHIAGEIRHYLRDGAEHVRAPRWVRKSYGEVTNTAASLRQMLGRTPTVAEIAAQMHLSVSGVLDILSAHNRARVHSINDLLEGQEVRPDIVGDLQEPSSTLPVEDRLMLLEALQRLPELQREVVYFLFYRDLTQSDVATRLGISQRHVSRVLTAALKRLAALLGPAEDGEAAASKPHGVGAPDRAFGRHAGRARRRRAAGHTPYFPPEGESAIRPRRPFVPAETAMASEPAAWDAADEAVSLGRGAAARRELEPCLAAAGG
jgi:RNA polymerase sigma-B factor